MKYRNRVTIDPKIMHVKPVIKGTRIPVYIILNLLADNIMPKGILACLEYAAKLGVSEVTRRNLGA